MNGFGRSWTWSAVGLLLLVASGWSSPAFASSFLSGGAVRDNGVGDGTPRDQAQCLFFSGPHGEFLGPDEFLILLIDNDAGEIATYGIAGTYETEKDRKETNHKRQYRLHPDRAAMRSALQDLVDAQFGAGVYQATLRDLEARVEPVPEQGDEIINCKVQLHGTVLDAGAPIGSLRLIYDGAGRHFTDFHGPAGEDTDPRATTAPAQDDCPIPNLVADTKFCEPSTCLLSFAGYQWWTNYHYRGPNDYYYDNHQAWSPRNAFVDGEELHLTVKQDDLGGGQTWASSEVVAMYQQDGVTPARLGYGTYLVAVRIPPSTAASFDDLDPNVAFGAFTYQKDESGDSNNPYRELDLAEISRWGHPKGKATCDEVLDTRLCEGNTQFTLQLWNKHPDNLHRYTIAPGVNEVTLVMEWPGAQKPVTFRQYNGLFTLASLESQKPEPAHTWTTSEAQNPYIPASGCQRFHMNLWQGKHRENNQPIDGTFPPPRNDQPQEIIVTNFEYKPL